MTTRRHRWASVVLVLMLVTGAATACSTATASMPLASDDGAQSTEAGTGTDQALPADFPVGSWTTTITEADLRAGGVTSAGELAENAGTFTMTLGADGTWTVTQVTDAPIRWPVFRGTYTALGADGFRQVTEFPGDFAGDEVDFGWRMQDGALRLEVRTPPDHILPLIMESHPWTAAG